MLTAIHPSAILKSQMPEDYGRHHARCLKCKAWLSRYHSEIDDGGLCWPCAPGGEGIVIEVEPGEWRRFTTASENFTKREAVEQGTAIFELLMSET